MFRSIRQDLQAVFDRDPAATSAIEVLFTYAGFHALLAYRMSHWLSIHHIPFLPRVISQIARILTGIEIHPSAIIGKGFFIDHGMGVVVGETAEIGEYVTLYQGVTLGGTGKERGKRHPTLGNHVVVGTGAKVLGNITIGDYVKIGAGSVVIRSVPDHSTVVGIPGKIVRTRGDNEQLEHGRLPDPEGQAIEELSRRIEQLEQQLSELRNESLSTRRGA